MFVDEFGAKNKNLERDDHFETYISEDPTYNF
jgi:hypothetical protein